MLDRCFEARDLWLWPQNVVYSPKCRLLNREERRRIETVDKLTRLLPFFLSWICSFFKENLGASIRVHLQFHIKDSRNLMFLDFISQDFHSVYYMWFIVGHNSPIYDECRTQPAWVLALPWEWAHQYDSNDTPQPIGEFQVDFPLLWIKANPGLS